MMKDERREQDSYGGIGRAEQLLVKELRGKTDEMRDKKNVDSMIKDGLKSTTLQVISQKLKQR